MSRQRRTSSSQRNATATGEIDPLPLPSGLTVEIVQVAGETLVVFGFPRKYDLLGPLTQAERAIVDLALQGFTTAQIARARGVARATVSSQLQAIYRKLGVTSRVELARKLD